jgi:hypothetical protein
LLLIDGLHQVRTFSCPAPRRSFVSYHNEATIVRFKRKATRPRESLGRELGSITLDQLARESFISRARSLPHDAKARSFQEAIKVIFDLARKGRGSGKAVVFTESITTQEYLLKLLRNMGAR